MTAARDIHLEKIAETIADYRLGEISRRTPGDIDTWVRQFDEDVQEPILAEMASVLDKLYVSLEAFKVGLRSIVKSPALATPSPLEYWRRVNFLWIQKKGESQSVMRQLFGDALQSETGLDINACGSVDGPFVYLDDCVFTGSHVRWDLIDWVRSSAPKTATVNVVALAIHDGRTAYTSKEVAKEAKLAGKAITIAGWWRLLGLADQDSVETAVLRPRSFPHDDPHVKTLVDVLTRKGHPPRERQVLTSDKNPVFSSEAARSLLEQEFLKAGARIKYELCTHLKENHWPLGYDVFKCPGFGSMLVTYRNCPNNCPLALWAGDPWKPLFPRRNNPAYQNFDPSVFGDETA